MSSKALATRTKKSDIESLIQKIRQAQLDVFESYVSTGHYLGIIKEEKLYEPEGYGTFADFLQDHKRHGFHLSSAEAWQAIKISEKYAAIKSLRDVQPDEIKDMVPLPNSQSQLKPLMKLADSRVGDAWMAGAIHAHKVGTPLTHQFITDFVNNIKTEKEPEEEEPHDVDFSVESQDGEAPRFSAAALECLARIDELTPQTFPEGSRASIEQELTRGVDNYALEQWNKQPADKFTKIGRLIFFRSMPFDLAFRFALRTLTTSSTIMDLVYTAVSYGGNFSFRVDNNRFMIKVNEITEQPVSAVA